MEILGFLLLAFLALALFTFVSAIVSMFLGIVILLLPTIAGFVLGGYLWEQGADNLGVIVIGISFYLQYLWFSWEPKSTLTDGLISYAMSVFSGGMDR